MYSMRTQIFVDGNKRASVIFANHYLIAHGSGLIVIPEKHVSDFKKMLVAYYESADISEISAFLKEKCWRQTEPIWKQEIRKKIEDEKEFFLELTKSDNKEISERAEDILKAL